MIVCFLSCPTFAETPSELSDQADDELELVEDDEDRSIVVSVLLYLPNRIFDILDIVRVRARVGPGISAHVQVTEPLSANVGTYATIFAGIPGPRREPRINWPIGAEVYSGAGISFFDIETEKFGPDYSPTEIVVDAQLLVAGFAIGIDPIEILDFAVGIIGFDLTGDDL